MTDWQGFDYADFVAEYNHTRPRHRGSLELAAPIFQISVAAMEMRLRRARHKGFAIEYHYYEGSA